MLAAAGLLARLGSEVAAVVVAMKQTTRWQPPLAAAEPGLADCVRAVFGCPPSDRHAGGWMPIEGTLPAIP